MIRRFFILLFVVFLSISGTFARSRGYTRIYQQRENGQMITVIEAAPIYVFPRKIDTRRYYKLIYNLKRVYPIAKEANETLRQMEEHLLTLDNERAQKAYIKEVEKELKTKYTPILRKMPMAQGKILIKLIDRETSRTSYTLVKDFRGGFSATMWQGMARLFGHNLKNEYDPYGEDRMLEILIMLYEAGEI